MFPSEGEILSPQQQSSDCKVGLMDCGMGALGRDQEYFQKNCEVLEGIRNISQKFGSSWKGSGIFPKNLGALGRDQEYFKKKLGALAGNQEVFQKHCGALGGDQEYSKNIEGWELLGNKYDKKL